jgi:hypothetical protein
MQKYKFILRQSPDYGEDNFQQVVAAIAGVISEDLENVEELEIDVDGQAIFFKSTSTYRQIKDAMKTTFRYYLDTVRYVDLVCC